MTPGLFFLFFFLFHFLHWSERIVILHGFAEGVERSHWFQAFIIYPEPFLLPVKGTFGAPYFHCFLLGPGLGVAQASRGPPLVSREEAERPLTLGGCG